MSIDYHVHTYFSRDSHERIENHIAQARAIGVTEICFTDHLDLDIPYDEDMGFDVDAQIAAIQAHNAQTPVTLKCGLEFGLREQPEIMQKQAARIAAKPYDYIIGSVHCVDGIDPWFPAFFEGKTRQEGFLRYIRQIYDCLQVYDDFCALGHIDYPVKGCPYDDKRLRYTDAPDLLDAIFSQLIAKGKCIEINTSVLKKMDGLLYDPQVLKRYAALGGEYVTIGSDAHNAQGLGYRFAQVEAFIKQCGIGYIATFNAKKPTFLRLP